MEAVANGLFHANRRAVECIAHLCDVGVTINGLLTICEIYFDVAVHTALGLPKIGKIPSTDTKVGMNRDNYGESRVRVICESWTILKAGE